MMSMSEEILEKAVKTYNKYRSSIATAKLLEVSGDRFKVQFEGNFRRSCCMDEYFVDLVYELKTEGLETELLEFHPGGDEKFVAEFKIVQ